MKRILALLLLSSMLFSLIPLHPVQASDPDTEEEFIQYIQTEGYPISTVKGKANFTTYKRYHLIVYGNPSGEQRYSEETGKMESRYLGYDRYNNLFTNSLFPPDATGSKGPEDWTFEDVYRASDTWDKLDPDQKNHMLYSTMHGNNATEPGFTVAYIGGKNKAKIQNAATWKSSGSVYTEHYGQNGVKYYATFTIDPMVGNTIVDGEIKTSSDVFVMEPDQDQITIPATLTATGNISGYAKAAHVQEIKANLGGAIQTKSGVGEVSVTKNYTFTRAALGAGPHTETLSGDVFLTTIFDDTQKVEVTKPIQIIVQEETQSSGPPVAIIDAPSGVETGTTFTVSGLNSYDPDMEPLTYQWQVLSGGVSLPSGAVNNPSFKWTITSPKTITLKLTVTDKEGLTDSDTKEINISETPKSEQLTVQLQCQACTKISEADSGYYDEGDEILKVLVENPKGSGYVPMDEVFDDSRDYEKYGLEEDLFLAMTETGKVITLASYYDYGDNVYVYEDINPSEIEDKEEYLTEIIKKYQKGEIDLYENLQDIDLDDETSGHFSDGWTIGYFLLWEDGAITQDFITTKIDETCEDPTPKYPPIARFSNRDRVEVGETVILKDQSSDKDGEIVAWQWSATDANGNPISEGVETDFQNGDSLITINQPMSVFVHLKVTDNDGLTGEYTGYIQAVYPKPIAKFDISGYPKANRKLTLDASETEALSSDSVNEKYPIQWETAEWTFTPKAGELRSEDIKISATSTDSIKYILSKKPGTVEVGFRVQNSRGDWSDWYTDTIEIEPDNGLTIDLDDSEQLITRNPSQATMNLKASISTNEGFPDYVDEVEWLITYDENNDGIFDEEAKQVLFQVIEGNLSSVTSNTTYAVNKVGDYKIEIIAREKFGQPSLAEFITAEDFHNNQASYVLKVDNIAPVLSFDMVEVKDIQILIDTGALNNTTVKSNLGMINSNLLSASIHSDTTVMESGVTSIPAYYGADWEPYNNVPANIGKGTIFKIEQQDISTTYHVIESGRTIYELENVHLMRELTHADGTYFLVVWEFYDTPPVYQKVHVLKRTKEGVWTKATIFENNKRDPWDGEDPLNKVTNIYISPGKSSSDTYIAIEEGLGRYDGCCFWSYSKGEALYVFYYKNGSWQKTYEHKVPYQTDDGYIDSDLDRGTIYPPGFLHLNNGELHLYYSWKYKKDRDDRPTLTKTGYNVVYMKNGIKISDWVKNYSDDDGEGYKDPMLWVLDDYSIILKERLEDTDSDWIWDRFFRFDRDNLVYGTYDSEEREYVADRAIGTGYDDDDGYPPLDTQFSYNVSNSNSRFNITQMKNTDDYVDGRLNQVFWAVRYYENGKWDSYTVNNYIEPTFEGYKLSTVKPATYLETLVANKVNQTQWNTTYQNFVIIFADESLQDLSSEQKKNNLLYQLDQQQLIPIFVGNTSTKSSLEQLISAYGKGTFININQEKNLLFQQISNYITLTLEEEDLGFEVTYLNSDMEYTVHESDTENDPIIAREWYYDHSLSYNHPDYGALTFENHQGYIEGNKQWKDNKIQTFNKVGKYTVKGRIKDDPTGGNENLANYRKYSNQDDLTLIVHRKPIAAFNVSLVKEGNISPLVLEENNLDVIFDSRGRYASATFANNVCIS